MNNNEKSSVNTQSEFCRTGRWVNFALGFCIQMCEKEQFLGMKSGL
jgi:hypothetical protein